MADSTRLFQLFKYLKECQDTILQQQTLPPPSNNSNKNLNTSFQQQLTKVSELLRTLVTNQTRPLERTPLAELGHVPPPGFFSRDDPRLNGCEARVEH
jgi:hypothetical protein